jgi:hypothetical protein
MPNRENEPDEPENENPPAEQPNRCEECGKRLPFELADRLYCEDCEAEDPCPCCGKRACECEIERFDLYSAESGYGGVDGCTVHGKRV